jgi:chromate reductase
MSKASTPEIRLLGIPGSIRRHATSKAVLEALRERLTDSGIATMTLFGLEALPLFNADLEVDGFPDSVRELHDAIRDSDGLVLCSPEYNYGVSGVLKNGLDWASRPALHSPLKGKPTLILTAAPSAVGGARAAHQVRETLISCLARVVPRPDIAIPRVHEKIVDGKFIDEMVLAAATRAVEDLIAEINHWR